MFIIRVRRSALSLEKRNCLLAARRFGWTSMPESLSLIQTWMRPLRRCNASPSMQTFRLEASSRRAGGFMCIGSPKSLGLPSNGRTALAALKSFAAGMASKLTQYERLTPPRSCVLQARTTGKTTWRSAKYDFYPLAGSILIHCSATSSVLRLLHGKQRRNRRA